MTPLTPEQIADNVAAVKAHLEGKPFEYYSKFMGIWYPCTNVALLVDGHHCRPAPVPVTRWWNRPEDVPAAPVVWVTRSSYGSLQELVIEITTSGLVLGRDRKLTTWAELEKDSAAFSLDRQTWQPCTVTEEAK